MNGEMYFFEAEYQYCFPSRSSIAHDLPVLTGSAMVRGGRRVKYYGFGLNFDSDDQSSPRRRCGLKNNTHERQRPDNEEKVDFPSLPTTDNQQRQGWKIGMSHTIDGVVESHTIVCYGVLLVCVGSCSLALVHVNLLGLAKNFYGQNIKQNIK